MVGQLQYCGNEVLKSTCQIFKKAQAFGSGLLIEVKGNHFLISAAHVLEPEFVDQMTIPNGEELIPINGELYTTPIPESGNRKDDKVDIAIVKLTKECKDDLARRFRFLSSSEFDSEHTEVPSHQYMFCGYPVETTEVKNMEMRILPKPLKVRTKITNKELTKVPDYSDTPKWVLEYRRIAQLNISTDQVTVSPHPKGVSGGGLWLIPCNPNIPIEETNTKLIGIMTDYFDGSDEVVTATDISIITNIIEKHFIRK